MPASISSGIGPSKATQPMGPRLHTIRARGLSSRITRMAASGSATPPAIISSSSVPTITSQSARTGARWALTVSEAMKRSSPAPWPARPHRFGR